MSMFVFSFLVDGKRGEVNRSSCGGGGVVAQLRIVV